jgi:hypothetical protein
MRLYSLRIQAIISNCSFALAPCGYFAAGAPEVGADVAAAPFQPSVPGEGVLGPCGPRTGNSSGVRPGNSSGQEGSSGSLIGGGTSGRGLPGGLSCGGSDGLPGLIGGSSGGSIGIYSPRRLSPRSGRVPVTAAAVLSLTIFRSQLLER